MDADGRVSEVVSLGREASWFGKDYYCLRAGDGVGGVTQFAVISIDTEICKIQGAFPFS